MKKQLVGQLQRPGQKPENVTLVVEERAPDRTLKYKTETTARTSGDTGDTFTDDPHLAGWTLLAGSVYRMEGLLVADAANATPDIKFQFDWDQTSVFTTYAWDGIISTGSVQGQDAGGFSTDFVCPLSTADTSIRMRGTFITHATIPTAMNFQWAQNTADAGDTTLFKGSWIRFEYMGPS